MSSDDHKVVWTKREAPFGVQQKMLIRLSPASRQRQKGVETGLLRVASFVL